MYALEYINVTDGQFGLQYFLGGIHDFLQIPNSIEFFFHDSLLNLTKGSKKKLQYYKYF